MKYLKKFEEVKKYKKNDLVICISKDLISKPTPLYGKTYQVCKTSRDYGNVYLKIRDIDTKEEFGWWNSNVFIPDYEFSANKYNL